MAFQTNCKKCGTPILERTANACDGKCRGCFRRRSGILAGVLTFLQLAVEIICVPIGMARDLIVTSWRRIRFPHKFAEIELRVQAMYPDARYARKYKQNVIRGFYSPTLGGLTSNPWNLPAIEGRADGSGLVRSELEFDSLPTREIPFEPGKWTVKNQS